MTPRFHTLRIAEVRRETAEAVSLRFELPAALAAEYAFVQGQHLTLRTQIDGAEVRRSYSICSGVDQGELRIAIKQVPGGLFSSWAIGALKPGDAIDVLTPEGRFHTPLDPDRARHYVAFAAGSGITPVLSLIRTTLAREPRSRFTLLYGNRNQAGVLFHEDLEDLKDRYLARFTLYHLFSRERQDVDLFNGRLDGARVRAFTDTLLPVDDIDEAFICGPGAMIDEVAQALRDAGMRDEHIHFERFGVPGDLPQAPASMSNAAPAGALDASADAPRARITVTVDGVRREVDYWDAHASILDAALAAGIDLPYSCKGGMCCTCRAKITEGKVRMDRNYSLEQPDLDAGYILTCQAHPLTETVAVSFDER